MMLSSVGYVVTKDGKPRRYYDDIRAALVAAHGDANAVTVETSDEIIVDMSDIDEVLTFMRALCFGKKFNIYTRKTSYDGDGPLYEDSLACAVVSFEEVVKWLMEFIPDLETPMGVIRNGKHMEFILGFNHPVDRGWHDVVIRPCT